MRGNLHGHILRAGVQGSPTARKGAGLNRSLNHDAARGIPQIKGELGGVGNLVVGVMVGRANTGEVSPTKDPEAGQAVEEVLVRAGQGRLPVAQGGAQNRHLLLRGGTALQAGEVHPERHVATGTARNIAALHHGVGRSQVIVRAPAKPHLLETAAVGTVAFPLAPAQARLGNIGHQNLADAI